MNYLLDQWKAAGRLSILDMFKEMYPQVDQYLLLNQRCKDNSKWISKDGQVVKIVEIDINHAINLKNWLEKRANAIHIGGIVEASYSLETHFGGDLAHDSIEQALNEIEGMSALDYLKMQPLYVVLKQRIENRQSFSQAGANQ